MTSDEKGYIQFTCEWTPIDTVDADCLPDLIRWRRLLFLEQLVGVDANGVGYGNISARVGVTKEFIITATQTGHRQDLDGAHFAHVTEFDIARNRVRCQGAIRASSESLSHAILYAADRSIGAVVHVHNAESWQRLKGVVATTDSFAEAGTVAMASEIDRLMKSSNLGQDKILVMGGHRDGLMSFGRNIEEASAIMLRACGRNVPTELMRD